MITVDKNNLSPMMQQYLDLKNKHKDHLLFFRLGDFYEMFFDDALLASKELELTLTGRDCGLEERAPMCGVPHHSVENYIARLIKKGYKVAICEQLENPALVKGMVKRDVVRVVTPGTLVESSLLDEGKNNYICSAYCENEGVGLSFADISTGEINTTQITENDENKIITELGKFQPNEIIFNSAFLDKTLVAEFIKDKLCCTADLSDDDSFEPQAAQATVLRQFGSKSLIDLGLEELPLAVASLGGLLSYLAQTQRSGMERLQSVSIYSEKQYMHLDITARRNLELTETMRTREKKGTLLWVLDKTKTSMGKRLIKAWIERPLLSAGIITRRLNAVEELCGNSILLSEVTANLGGVYDMERLMTKIVYGNATPRDITALGATLQQLPAVKELLSEVRCDDLQEIYTKIDPLYDICDLIASAIAEEPPITLKDGGVVRKGYDAALDDLRYTADHTKEIIASIETSERERTGIKNLKIGYNKVFGYYIEVTRSYMDLVPDTYIRKQTLANCERFITQQLKDLEAKVLGAQQQIIELESAIFEAVRQTISAELGRIQTTAAAVAKLDVLCSLATVALRNNYVRPIVDASHDIIISDGRHPVVEEILSGCPFVPNDTKLDNNENQIAVITGPNMAGKSTYMRQVALITLMAQIGSFVPASYAKIGIVDAIFTRVGASDDLSTGQSTFMVEMSEVASILKNATSNSLLILDEIGRGTSTFDGMSIARAVIEFIADKKRLGAKTLFATHYHELTVLEETIPCVKNYNIAVKKRGEEITFLRRILPGGVDDSYGIEVSKLAGIPQWIINRAFEVLKDLEAGRAVEDAKISTRAKKKEEEEIQQTFFVDESAEFVKKRLRDVDVNTMSPIEALNLLYELKKVIK
ncbi:MAG: DNA mismatch repair protein MutS [Angelakisella sp.]|nr:DNA mismatch repair protein MutS [Angelakisella sp.]